MVGRPSSPYAAPMATDPTPRPQRRAAPLEWWRTVRALLAHRGRQGVTSLVFLGLAAVAGVLGLVHHFKHGPGGFWPWIWVCALGLLAVALFVFANEMRIARDRLRAEPVDDLHFGEIKSAAAAVRRSVESNGKCDVIGDHARHVLIAHTRNLTPDLDVQMWLWDQAMDSAKLTAKNLQTRLRKEFESRGLTARGFNSAPLFSRLETKIRVEANARSSPFPPLVWRENVDGVSFDDVPEPLAIMTLEEMQDHDLMRERVRPIDELFAESESWHETKAYATRDTDTNWKALKPPLLASLDRLATRRHFKTLDGCVDCE